MTSDNTKLLDTFAAILNLATPPETESDCEAYALACCIVRARDCFDDSDISELMDLANKLRTKGVSL